MGLVKNPRMNGVRSLRYEQQVIPAKVIGLHPPVTVFVEARDCDVISLACLGMVLPDKGFDQSKPRFKHRLLGH
jgi:hypothetical protein